MTNPNAFCRECGTAISENAGQCPSCGAPQSTDSGLEKLALFIAAIAGVAGFLALGIVFGPVGIVAGGYAFTKVDGGYRWLAGATVAVGLFNLFVPLFLLFRWYMENGGIA